MGVSDDLKIVSGEVMPADPIRGRLKKLVEVWRSVADEWRRAADTCERGSITDALLRHDICVTKDHADKLEALLAESEPVDWSQPQDLIITIEGPLPEPAPLKLGHPYENHHEDQGVDCSLAGLCHYGAGLRKCGQPREAH